MVLRMLAPITNKLLQWLKAIFLCGFVNVFRWVRFFLVLVILLLLFVIGVLSCTFTVYVSCYYMHLLYSPPATSRFAHMHPRAHTYKTYMTGARVSFKSLIGVYMSVGVGIYCTEHKLLC